MCVTNYFCMNTSTYDKRIEKSILYMKYIKKMRSVNISIIITKKPLSNILVCLSDCLCVNHTKTTGQPDIFLYVLAW